MSETEKAYWDLCARHEFERVCGADVKYVSHKRFSDKIEFLFEITALGKLFAVGIKPEEDIEKIAVTAGEHAQSMADSKLGKFDARIALAKQVAEERTAA